MNGTFESQVIVRATVIVLRDSQMKYVRYRARKQERAEEQAQRRLESQKEADARSIHSTSSRVTTSTVVVEEPPTAKNADEKPGVPALPCPAVVNANDQPDSIQLVGQPASQMPTKPNVAEDDKEKTSSKLSTSFNNLSVKVSDTMSGWTHKIFGKDDEFSKDWESQKLEAWVFQTTMTYGTPIKVPFGHQRLQYGLKNIRKVQNSTPASTMGTFRRYIEEGPRMQV